MRCEIPLLKRCCCCLPLRHGIIVLGYLSLVIAVLLTWIVLHYNDSWTDNTGGLYRGVGFFTEKWLIFLLYSIEIVFLLIMLVGAHTKRPKLVRVYYYYGITTTAAALALFILFVMNKNSHFHRYANFYEYYLIDLCTVFIGMVTQVYLLLLIHSELQKPRASSNYVNPFQEVCLQQERNGLTLS